MCVIFSIVHSVGAFDPHPPFSDGDIAPLMVIVDDLK